MDKHPLDGWLMVICNPVSGSGRGLARLAALRRVLDSSGVRYRAEVTTGPGDPARKAAAAVAAGCSAVAVIGGDGTFFESVNGVMGPTGPVPQLGAHTNVAMGLIQAGRGSDFGRSAGIPTDVEAACARLLAGRTSRVDLGHVTYLSFHGKPRSRYFANAAGLGFDAEVSLRANAAPRALGGTVPYLSSLLATLWSYRNKPIDVCLDGRDKWRGKVNSIVIANGQYFGGGMKIAPEAELSDGQFEVVVLGDLGKIDLVRNVPRVYDGSHVTHPKVSIRRARHVEVASPRRLLLQADGEVLGMAPATLSIMPAALRLIV